MTSYLPTNPCPRHPAFDADYCPGCGTAADLSQPAPGHDCDTGPDRRCTVCGAPAEDVCAASYTTGGHDPYGTTCDQEAGHYPGTPHSGADPMGGDGRVTWRGGGYVAGDPLPYREVQHSDQYQWGRAGGGAQWEVDRTFVTLRVRVDGTQVYACDAPNVPAAVAAFGQLVKLAQELGA